MFSRENPGKTATTLYSSSELSTFRLHPGGGGRVERTVESRSIVGVSDDGHVDVTFCLQGTLGGVAGVTTEHPLKSDDAEEAEPHELADRTEEQSESRTPAREARLVESNDAGRPLTDEDKEGVGGASEELGVLWVDDEDAEEKRVAPDVSRSGKLRWRLLTTAGLATEGRSHGERRECSGT
jgi:hypothetical protein